MKGFIVNKNIIKYLWFLLAVILILQFVCMIFVAPSKEKNNELVADFNFETQQVVNENNETICYKLISTPEQLLGAFLAEQTKAEKGVVYAADYDDYFLKESNYKLRNDIDLKGVSWVPAQLSAGITLDGDYCTIKNLKVSYAGTYVGFISQNYGTIKNLFFENINVSNTNTAGVAGGTGAIAGYNKGTIKNIVIKSGSVSGNAFGTYNGNNNLDRRTGGVVGYNYGGTISWCENRASVTTGKHIGGIVGKQDSGTIKLCYNYATVRCGPNVYPRVGGICGEVMGGTLTQCINYGKMSNDWYGSVVQHTDIRIGGIAGMAGVNLSECGNYGEIYSSYQTNSSPYQTVYAKESYAGGVAGYSTQTIKNCFNEGKVTSRADTKYNDEKLQYKINFVGQYISADGVNYNNDGTLYPTDMGNMDFNGWCNTFGNNSLFHIRELYNDDNYFKMLNKTVKSGFAHAYGIGYTTNTASGAVSECYSIGNIDGGSNRKTIFRFTNLYFHKGLAKSDKFNVTFEFDNGKFDYGFITNGNVNKCYYYKNVTDTSRKFYYDGTGYAYGAEVSKSFRKKDQYFKIIKAKNSEAVYIYLNDEDNESDAELNDNAYGKNLMEESSKALGGKRYFTFGETVSYKGTEKSSVSNVYTAAKTYFSSTYWATDSGINSGRPFLKCFYWKYA